MMSVNQRAAAIIRDMVADSEALGVQAHTLANGAVVVDAGVKVPGSLAAGLRFAEACLGGLAQIDFTRLEYADGGAGEQGVSGCRQSASVSAILISLVWRLNMPVGLSNVKNSLRWVPARRAPCMRRKSYLKN